MNWFLYFDSASFIQRGAAAGMGQGRTDTAGADV